MRPHPGPGGGHAPAAVLRCLLGLALSMALWWSAGPVQAQALEAMLAPGKLALAHAKLEEKCQNCHVRFDRNAQDRLCMDCHKDIGRDVKGKKSFHGRMTPQSCKSCHAEHKGRELQLAVLDRATFDHQATDYALRSAHRSVECAKCHLPGKGYRIAARDCAACHRKDDVHKGSLGTRCADCHTEARWKEARLDHSTTRFALTGKHDEVKCAACHKDTAYRETPHDCIACHKKDDKHQTRFGDRCETCHATGAWKTVRFNHDADTHYPLLGKHRAVRCESCHAGNLYHDKPATTCDLCHHQADAHKGTLGRDCAHCHSERDWKEPARFNHDRTAFALRGKHVAVQCKDCHSNAMFKEAPKVCIGCHLKDDRHKGSLGKACEGCHTDRAWNQTDFDHARTAFPLVGGHRKAQCSACHRTTDYKAAPKDCFGCHRPDDKHEGQEGRSCERCHDERAWKPAPGFDHGLASFALLGRHAQVECKMCHAGPLFKAAKTDCHACHAKDDKHDKTLGTACEQCHNARSWKAWNFDHDLRTKFVLDGRHKGLVCSACHIRPAQDRVIAASLCVSCHTRDDVHEGRFGRQCQQCHVSASFKAIRGRSGRTVGRGPTLAPTRWTAANPVVDRPGNPT